MNERFLQYVWQHQLFERKDELITTDGRLVRVIHPGSANYDAGPDFFNSRLQIDGVEWVGNIEVHVRTSDWNSHRHTTDKKYNNIILHVVYEHNCEIVVENGRTPCTLQMKDYMAKDVEEKYIELMESDSRIPIPCHNRLKSVPPFVLNNFLSRLNVERIEEKSQIVKQFLNESHGGWSQTCYWLFARYFGGAVNALPFELMAKATDLRLLARWKDNPDRVEAILLGQAGMLDDYFEDDYPRQLQADYQALRVGSNLKPIDSYLWKFFCLRPSNFPTIRISQFAQLIVRSNNLFESLLSLTDISDIRNYFTVQASPYWDTHYRFDQPPSKKVTKKLGLMQADMLIINAWIPLLFVYGVDHGSQEYKDQAINLLHQIKAEHNRITRIWENCGVKISDAAQSQALIQLFNNYCANQKCLECGIGYQIIKRK